MNLKLEICRNSDGEVATDFWANLEYNTYWWERGNASCDCNRELFFLRARNENDPDDTECSDGRFSVRLSDADTGEILYDELTQNSRLYGSCNDGIQKKNNATVDNI